MKSALPHSPCRSRRAGFTLIELLTVISIIAILAAILVPTVTIAIVHVKRAKTRVQLSNLVTAARMYKSQYKVWPAFDISINFSADTAYALNQHTPIWVQVMTGNPDPNHVNNNRLKIPFATFGDADVSTDPTSTTPIDAFGNDDLYLVFNTNLANIGQIQPTIVNGVAMNSAQDKTISIQQNSDVNINADCVGMSPGEGFSNDDAVTTWDIAP
jgi:prepilin-type N-terminal cleavage/methylation domain-containing protein